MSVKIDLGFKFPITSAPTPIPDAELYEDKTLPDGRKVWISAPQPDKLTFVIPISKWVYAKHISPTVSVSDFMAKFVEHVTNPPSCAEVLGSSGYAYNSGKVEDWRNTTHVYGKRDARVFISRVKEKQLGLCIRLDLNPRKLGPSGCKHLRQFLEGLFDLPELLQAARVRRLDVAVDVVGLSVAETVAFHKLGVKRSIYIGGDGQIETIYIHKKASPTKLPKDPDSPEKPKLPEKTAGDGIARIYDRVKFAEVLHKSAPFQDAPVTRVEVMKPRFKDFKLGELSTMKDPLKKLRVGYIGSQVSLGALRQWWMYQAACRTISPDSVANLLQLSSENASLFKSALLVPVPDLVGPKTTWNRWADGLTQTGLAHLLED